MVDIIELIYEDHVWFRRYFFYLDAARTDEERAAIWEPLASRLDAHAQAEEEIFYPALLQQGEHGDPTDETDDAIGDHNDIRNAVRASRSAAVGSEEWWQAVTQARKANGEHLEEEEREGMTGVIRDVSLDDRRDLGMRWLRFYAVHWGGAGVDDSDRDPADYIAENS